MRNYPSDMMWGRLSLAALRAFRPVYVRFGSKAEKLAAPRGEQTAWLGRQDSNSEMSSQIISLKARTDFQESSRILATETIRV